MWFSVPAWKYFLAYYLPWKKNHSRIIKLGGYADFFFTSDLTGCTVEVHGSPLTPVVTHTNAGSIQDEMEAQDYMNSLLDISREGPFSWEIIKGNEEAFKKTAYKSIAERYLGRKKFFDINALAERGIELKAPPATKAVVVGFRDDQSGFWSFYYQQWIRLSYRKIRQIERKKFLWIEKDKIVIKKVGRLWPERYDMANAWKEVDLDD